MPSSHLLPSGYFGASTWTIHLCVIILLHFSAVMMTVVITNLEHVLRAWDLAAHAQFTIFYICSTCVS